MRNEARRSGKGDSEKGALLFEPFVQGPDLGAAQSCGCQKMGVHPADPLSVKSVGGNKVQDLVMSRRLRLWKRPEKIQNFIPVF